MPHVDPAVLDARRADMAARREEMTAAAAQRRRAVRQRSAHSSAAAARALLAPGRKSATPKEIIEAAAGLVAVPDRDLDPLDAKTVLMFAVCAIGDLELRYQREWLRAEKLARELVQSRADSRALAAVAARPVASKTTIHRDAQGELASTETTYR